MSRDYAPCDFCNRVACTCANCGHSYPAHDERQDSLKCGVINYPGITPDFTGTTEEPCGCEMYICPNFQARGYKVWSDPK